MAKVSARLKKGTAAAGIAIALIGGFEGLRQNAYPDPATGGKPWTICYGHTVGVRPGDRKSIEECKALLVSDLQAYASGIEACVTAPMPDTRFIALVSFAFNVGVKAACGSSVVRLINQGRTKEGCNALLKWNRAAGIVFPGLTKRRQREQAFCLEGA
jgi:lysozyme